jgi:hypothetical protein
VDLRREDTVSPHVLPVTATEILLDIFHGVYLSPDGHWAAHESNRGGRTEIYVRSFGEDGELGPAVQVSPDGGVAPRWSRRRDGNALELSYLRGEELMVVSVETVPRLRIGDPRVEASLAHLEIMLGERLPDGRWLVNQRLDDSGPASEIRVVQNWFEELK